ncbi:hypothetical protein L1887_48007 [Cichorium endivia]|nr:hypothetical protein L1887_48007 [Cichorium endivia]
MAYPLRVGVGWQRETNSWRASDFFLPPLDSDAGCSAQSADARLARSLWTLKPPPFPRGLPLRPASPPLVNLFSQHGASSAGTQPPSGLIASNAASSCSLLAEVPRLDAT